MSDGFSLPNETFETGPFAPTKKRSRAFLGGIVLLAGIVTSVVTLVILFFVGRRFETDPLSITVLEYFPIAALFIGAAAGSGYAIACRVLHFKASWGLIGLIILLQACSFVGGRCAAYWNVRQSFFNDLSPLFQKDSTMVLEFLNGDAVVRNATAEETRHFEEQIALIEKNEAQGGDPAEASDENYTEFVVKTPEEDGLIVRVDEGDPRSMEETARAFLKSAFPSFWEYYRDDLESGTRSEIGNEKEAAEAKPLGKWGYLFELIFLLAFALSPGIAMLFVLNAPYCQNCAKYLRKIRRYNIPARAAYVKIAAKETAARELFDRRDTECFESTTNTILEFLSFLQPENGRRPSRQEILERLETTLLPLAKTDKELAPVPNWYSLRFYACDDCDNWTCDAKLVINPNEKIPNRFKHKYLGRFSRDGERVTL